MEEWKQIDGYENYEVSSYGRVRNKSGLIMKHRYCGVYPQISTYNNGNSFSGMETNVST